MRLSKSCNIDEGGPEVNQIYETEADIDTIGFFCAAWNILSSSFNITIINVAYSLIEIINLIVIGNYMGINYLCGLGISYCWINVTSASILLGIISTIEGNCTDALDRNDQRGAKIYYNRSSIILFALSIPFIIIFSWYPIRLLDILCIPHEIGILAQDYCRYASPGFLFMIQFQVSKQYANSIGIEKMQSFSCCAITLLHIFFCYIFSEYFKFGFNGIAIATSTTQFCNFLSMRLIILYYDTTEESQDTWAIKEIMNNLWKFIKESFLNGVTVWIEWLGLELLTIESAYLTINDLAATVIIQSILSLIFLLSWNISVSATTYIEASTEDRRIGDRRRYAIRSVIISILVLFPIIILLRVFSRQLATVFTNSTEIQDLICNLLYGSVEAVILFDGTQAVLGGIIKGIGKPDIASYGNLASYYLLVQPFAIVLGFWLDMGIEGFWLGMTIGLFFNTIFFIGILISQNWRVIDIEWIEFPDENPEVLAKSDNIGNYNNPDAKAIELLIQNN